MISRRLFCGSLVAAPAVLRLGLWMPIKAVEELDFPHVMWGYELYEWRPGEPSVWRQAVYEKQTPGWRRRNWAPGGGIRVDIVPRIGDGFVGSSTKLAQAT